MNHPTTADENPDLYDELLEEDEYEDYVEDVAKRMKESYEIATAGVTDPARRATAREGGDRAGARRDRACGAAGVRRVRRGRCT